LDGFGDLTKKRITVACLFVRLKWIYRNN